MNARMDRLALGGLLTALALIAQGCQETRTMQITQQDWGMHDEQAVTLYTLDNGEGMIAKITNYGGIVTELLVPDRDGNTADVVLGFDTLDEYVASRRRSPRRSDGRRIKSPGTGRSGRRRPSTSRCLAGRAGLAVSTQ